MSLSDYFDPEIIQWVILPILIFCARILDVSLGTLRIVFISRGDKSIAPLLGFFEVLIWIVAIGQVMQNLGSVLSYFAWAGGFATGNYLGLVIEQRLAIGQVVLRVISTEPSLNLMYKLNEMGFRTIIIDADSSEGKKNVLFSIVKRKNIPQVAGMIKETMPGAFYTIEGIQQFGDTSIFIEKKENMKFRRFFPVRKAK